MRATLNNVPATSDLCRIGAMPLAVVICPLALPDPRDDPIQVTLPLMQRLALCQGTRVYALHG